MITIIICAVMVVVVLIIDELKMRKLKEIIWLRGLEITRLKQDYKDHTEILGDRLNDKIAYAKGLEAENQELKSKAKKKRSNLK